jgi:2',3'-cyclic-nucleotide 2'-phosphodiesterase (5'-nucleotidase family)
MYHNKKIKNIVLVFFIFALLFPVMAFGGAHDLVIYHTNDVHGYAFEALDRDGKVTNIGYDRLKAIVDADLSPRKLLLDAGDVLHGQSFATARKGDLLAIVLSMAGYDALAVGNHDFDYGQERLLELVDKYRLNFLSANIVNGSGENIFPPYLVRSWSNLKVGIFGLSTTDTRTSTNPRNIEGLKIEDPIETSRKTVGQLKNEGVDLIIVVAHIGSDSYCNPSSLTIAENVPGIDIIIDGHSHSVLATRVERSDGSTALVASTGSSFKNIGKVMIDRKPDGGFTISAETLPASSPEIEAIIPDPAMHSAMTALKTELDKEMNVVVMKSPFDLDGERERIRSSSTNMGRIICASFVEETGADAAFLNGGSVRDSIPAGDVTKGELLSVLPYGNYVYTIDILGQDLLDALNHGLSEPGDGAFPQFWGMEVVARSKENGGFAVESVVIGGKTLTLNEKYTLAINDFLHSGGDGYEMFKKYDYQEFATMEEMFRLYMTEKDAASLKAVSDTEVLQTKR